MKKYKRLLLSTILLILALSTAYFLFTLNKFNNQTTGVSSNPTPSTTQASNITGWQTFSDSQYGISLKYPAGWSIKELTSTNVNNLVLSKNGYVITVQICSLQHCGAAAGQQTYDLNTRLSPYVVVSLNIDNHKAWRDINPLVNGEGSDAPYFNFTFLRPVLSSSDHSGFNDTSRFTPVSNWLINNGMAYTIDYQLSNNVTASDYDRSIVSQMDQIVQTIKFI
ncbi:MAG: hypothetical protein KGI49_00040 [Patescibacteria group bacterium]|nr:hypothetical protein [Patescibacteria group bacterium]